MDFPTDPFENGRDDRGRFTTGNPGGPGNPHAAKVMNLRSALFRAVTEQDVRDVLAALIAEAKAGNVAAQREFFNRVLGQAEAVDVLERLDELEALLERAAAEATR